MIRRILILVLISGLTALRGISQVTSHDDSLRRIISHVGQVEVTIPYTNRKSVDLLTTNVSILSVRNKVVHISLSPQTVEWFILQKYDYQIVANVEVKGLLSAANVDQLMNWDQYPTYSQYDSIMQSFVKLYPSLCQLDTIGTSVNGKLVLALKISDNAAINEDEPEVFYSSTIHGDETGGFILMLHLADYLLKNYTVSSRVKNLVDNLQIWINPLANPDGTYGSGNTISSPTRYNANGYDLNRNFPDPFTPNTVKQKETLGMVKFMRKHKFILSANFHSGEEVVNYPWDRWLSKFHADDSWFNSISRAYADTAHVYAGPAYMNFLDNGVTRGAVWYIVYGGRQDYMTWELHGREVTIELDDQYVTPAAQLTLLWQNNWHSLLGYLENALYGIHGSVRDVNTHNPVPAKVFIDGYDKDSSQVYSDTLTGSFVRFLSPGLWNLTFSAKGYWPLTISNINVTNRQKTDLVVDMSPYINKVENPNSSTSLLLYPNPARNEIRTLLPDTVGGNFNVKIINPAGKLVSEYITESVQGIPVLVDIKMLPSGTYTIVFTNTITRTSFHGRFVVIK
jgi:Zinc carboxypeptidase/Secretion system C-terminal sorting domain